jgi:hypothetical protein
MRRHRRLAVTSDVTTLRIRSAIALDFREASGTRRLALVGVVGWLCYEWGPGNETVTPLVVANIISTHTGFVVIPLTMAMAFALTTAQQLMSGFTALAGFSLFDRTARAAWARLRRTTSAQGSWDRLGPGGRVALVFGLGTTAVALIQIMSTGTVGVRRHASVICSSAFLCGTIVALISGVVAAVAFAGRGVTGVATATEWMLRILGNPLFWIGLLLLGAAAHLARRHVQRQHAAPMD